MSLWVYLKAHIEKYTDRIAFANAKLTYKDILAFEKNPETKKLILCEGQTKEEQAITILKCIAEGNVAVPITKEYGKVNYEYINKIVKNPSQQDISDLAFLMFTSGTTGCPKGVMLTEQNIVSNLEYISTYFDVRLMRTICISRPLVHIAVLTGELLYSLCNGLTLYFYEEAFMPQRLLTYFANNKIDIFCATPTLYYALAVAMKSKLIPLKIGVTSGEILLSKVSAKLKERFPYTAFYNVYGLTEHSPRVSALRPMEFWNKPNSVGKPIEGVEVKIQEGELLVKSDSVMRGYYNDERQTQEKIKAGWLHTGDMAHFDSDGYLYIDGRKDNMMIRAGINVYPEEIESKVYDIAGIFDCVVYCDQTEVGKTLVLKYIGDVEPKDVRKSLMKQLNPNIIPNRIEKVDKLEKTASGKKQRA